MSETNYETIEDILANFEPPHPSKNKIEKRVMIQE